jgi:hypothetical protein
MSRHKNEIRVRGRQSAFARCGVPEIRGPIPTRGAYVRQRRRRRGRVSSGAPSWSTNTLSDRAASHQVGGNSLVQGHPGVMGPARVRRRRASDLSLRSRRHAARRAGCLPRSGTRSCRRSVRCQGTESARSYRRTGGRRTDQSWKWIRTFGPGALVTQCLRRGMSDPTGLVHAHVNSMYARSQPRARRHPAGRELQHFTKCRAITV